jgi:hypothetical protein
LETLLSNCKYFGAFQSFSEYFEAVLVKHVWKPINQKLNISERNDLPFFSFNPLAPGTHTPSTALRRTGASKNINFEKKVYFYRS